MYQGEENLSLYAWCNITLIACLTSVTRWGQNLFEAAFEFPMKNCRSCNVFISQWLFFGWKLVKYPVKSYSHLSTAVAWREKKCKHFVFNKYLSLVLGLLKSRILEKINQALLNKHDFKLFHYKARIRKITTIATRNRC